MNERSKQTVHILLVEDNPGDVDLTLRALRNGKISNTIAIATDGDEAMAYLRREGRHAQAPRPNLIFLDLNLPKMDGREVLTAIKADAALCDIPVVILTSSAAERDIVETYRLQANCYVTKPVELAEFLNVVKTIKQFWVEIVQLPQ